MYDNILGDLALVRQQHARHENKKMLPEILRRKVMMMKETSEVKER